MYIVAKPETASHLAGILREIAERVEAGDVHADDFEQRISGHDVRWTARFSWRW